jgi:GNAT superfamily N-acetyltransferase
MMPHSLIPIVPLSHRQLPAIIKHLLSLSPEARRFRFGMALPDSGVERYANHLDFDQDGLFGIFDDDINLVAFMHAARAGSMVEFGVSVDPQYRGRGYGTALFKKAELFARNHFIYKMYVHCLRENEPMMRIARRAGMSIVFDAGEADSYLELPPADTGSLTEELTQNEYASFDLALKEGVHHLENTSVKMQALYSSYLNAFRPKPLRPFTKARALQQVKNEDESMQSTP